MVWHPRQYAKFREERARPFHDLFQRIPPLKYKRIADLGCGTGELTQLLSERWPEASVTGMDSSAEMLAEALPRTRPGSLDFQKADLGSWDPQGSFDLIVSNAALQWLPDHARLLPRILGWLGGSGVLAVQVPANHDSPSHLEILKLAREERWRDTLSGEAWAHSVEALPWYTDLLHSQGFEVDAWETTYYHILQGSDPVLEWLKGTALRPVLARLGPEGPAFLETLAPRLRAAYPTGPGGTIFPFLRFFFVAKKQ